MNKETSKKAQIVYKNDVYEKLEKVASDMDVNVSALCKAMIAVGLQQTYGIRLADVDVKKPKSKTKKSPTVQ